MLSQDKPSANLQTCDYCGLIFRGPGYSPDSLRHFCCYGCHIVDKILGPHAQDKVASWTLTRLWAGAFLSMNVMMLSLVLYTNSSAELGMHIVRGLRWAIAILATPAIAILSGPYLLGSIGELRRRRLSSDALILTGSLAAYGVSLAHVIQGMGHIYFDTASMLLLIVTLGRLLEASAKGRASRIIGEMMERSSDTARVLRDGMELDIPNNGLRIGDLMLIKPGERIPADGLIVDGNCMLEESMFTGESRPRACAPGADVFGGSINCDGLITVKVTAGASDSLLARIREMAYQSQQRRPRFERLAERTASAFVPIVWAISVAAALYWGLWHHDYQRAGLSALAVLVVACPCAFGVATPLATSLAIGKAYRGGVLVRSGELFERLRAVRKVFFDKTGTLTDNHLMLSEIRVACGTDESDALAWAASLESGSEHPIAKAIVKGAQERGLSLGTVSDFRAISGGGARGTVTLDGETRQITVGSPGMLLEGHMIPDDLRAAGDGDLFTTAHIGWDGLVQAVFLLDAGIRPDAQNLVNALRDMGLESAIISGDGELPTRRLAEELGISEVYFGCSPEGKAALIRSARDQSDGGIAVVGDGINDAIALSAADVGIAIGSGTDLARQSSDVTLLGSDILRIPWLIRLSKTTIRIAGQNLIWAFGYNSAAIILAFMGFIHPLIAAAAMVVSSAFVTANSMRLLQEPDQPAGPERSTGHSKASQG